MQGVPTKVFLQFLHQLMCENYKKVIADFSLETAKFLIIGGGYGNSNSLNIKIFVDLTIMTRDYNVNGLSLHQATCRSGHV